MSGGETERVKVHFTRTMEGTVKTGRSGKKWFTADGNSAMLFVTDEEIVREGEVGGRLQPDEQVLLEGKPAVVVSVGDAIEVETAEGTFVVAPEQLTRLGS